MKFYSKLVVTGFAAALVNGSMAVADEAQAPAGDVVVEAPVAIDEVETKTPEDKVVDPKDAATDDASDEAEVTDSKEGGEVPIEWVIRGGENPDVIYYNMSAGGPGAPAGEGAPASKELGHDEKAAAIETKENGVVPQINREKKGPVALLKKGRVFLR